MRLTELELTNFKVFGESTKIPIRPITLIFGPNSSGKSSILQSLLLMKQTATSESTVGNSLLFSGPFADLGSYTEVVHGHDTSKSISIGVKLDLSDEAVTVEEFSRANALTLDRPEISLQTNFLSGRTAREGIVDSIEVAAENEKLVFKAPTENGDPVNSTRAEVFRAFQQRFSAPVMYVSAKPEDNPWLFEQVVRPLVKEAIDGLKPEIELLHANFASAPDVRPEPVKLAKRVSSYTPSKADIARVIEPRERLLQILMEYTVDSFFQDHDAALGKMCIGLRGCILDRSLLVDQNQDIIYPNVERLAGPNFYPEKFKELVASELFTDGVYVDPSDVYPEDSVDWDEVYNSRYNSLTRVWLMDLALIGAEAYRRFLQKLLYVGPLRRFPSRYYVEDTHATDSVGKTGENSPSLLFHRPDLLERVNQSLERLRLGYELVIGRLVAKEIEAEEGVFVLRLEKRGSGISSSIVDVGFGVSQILPIVLQCLISEKSAVCIEQPEIHLHPAVQAELGDLFIDSALGEQKNTLLIETHSEHIILRVLRRIRETSMSKNDTLPPITADDVSLLFVGDTVDGSSILPLRIDDQGRIIDPVPGGFFEEGFAELF